MKSWRARRWQLPAQLQQQKSPKQPRIPAQYDVFGGNLAAEFDVDAASLTSSSIHSISDWTCSCSCTSAFICSLNVELMMESESQHGPKRNALEL
jgi:hypothetical protein